MIGRSSCALRFERKFKNFVKLIPFSRLDGIDVSSKIDSLILRSNRILSESKFFQLNVEQSFAEKKFAGTNIERKVKGRQI